MKLMVRLGALLMAGAIAGSGCATMLKGTDEQIMISSDPVGADVKINGQSNGKTPYVATFPSSKDLQIRVTKDGYQPQEVTDATSFRWGYEIWSFLCYIIPMGIDMADGAAWGHDQTMLAVHLDPISPAGAQAQTPAPAPQAQPSAAPAPPAASWGDVHKK